jgi:hypothetical protein
VFDAGSSLFWEAVSGFFFDPNRKLYINGTTHQLYQYTPHTEPPFTEVSRALVKTMNWRLERAALHREVSGALVKTMK